MISWDDIAKERISELEVQREYYLGLKNNPEKCKEAKVTVSHARNMLAFVTGTIRLNRQILSGEN